MPFVRQGLDMGKMAVIGDRESVLGFQSIGIEAYPVIGAEGAGKLIHRLAKEQYVIIFITEEIALQVSETIEAYSTVPYPALIVVPSGTESTNVGMASIRQNVEKALGSDILFQDK